jgi:CO/xanthine dehydrogenase Mo-binding subunit
MDDLPEIITLFVEKPTPEGPFGAKGIGEVPTVGPGAAIANAIARACGVRFTRLPMTADFLLKELTAKDR